MLNIIFKKANAEYLIHCLNEHEPIRAPQTIDDLFAVAGACFASIQLSIQSDEKEASLRRHIESGVRAFADTLQLIKEGKYDELYPGDEIQFSIGTDAEAKEAERQGARFIKSV